MLRTISFIASLIMSVCLPLNTFAQVPTATLSGDQSVCLTVPIKLTVAFTGTAPWNFSYTDGISIQSVSSITQNPYTLIVIPDIRSFTVDTDLQKVIASYTLTSISDINSTSGIVNGNAKLTLQSTSQGGIIPLSISGPSPIYCPLGKTILSTTPGFIYYKWLKDGIEISNSFSETSSLDITDIGVGNYSVTGVDNTCAIKSSTQSGLKVLLTEPFSKPLITGNLSIKCGTATILSTPVGYVRYDWMLNNTIIQTGRQNTVNASNFGEGKYSVIVYDLNGCGNISENFIVTEIKPAINSVPENPLNATAVRCVNGNNILKATDGFNKYDWMLNDQIIKSSTDSTLDVNIFGEGKYSVKVYDNNGCFSTSLKYPIKFTSSDRILEVKASSTSICPGQKVDISINVSNGVYNKYEWSNGTKNSLTIAITQPGMYSIVATDFAGCQYTNSIIINQPSKFYDINITTSGSNSVCDANVLIQSESAISNYFYNWNKNGVLYSTNYTRILNVYESGSYTLDIIPDRNFTPSVCFNRSNAKDIIVANRPIYKNEERSTFICGQLSLYKYTAKGAGVNQIYKWYSGNSLLLYTSTGNNDNTYSSNLSEIYVSIYDQIAGCETAKTYLYYVIEPKILPDQNISVCSEGPSTITLYTDLYNYVGIHKWYTVPTGGIPIYTSSSNLLSNSYTISKPTESKVIYVEFISANGCQTNRAAVNIKFIQSVAPIVTLSPLCSGANVNIIMQSLDATKYFLYDSLKMYLNQDNSYFNVPVNNKTYYVSAYKNYCESAFTPVRINAKEAIPIPTPTYNITPLCDQKATITFTGQALLAAIHTWNFAGGTIISGSGSGPYVVRWPVTGTKSISLQVTQNGCTSNTTTQNYTVSAAPVPSFSLASTTFCQSTTTVPLAGTPSGGVFNGAGVSGNAYIPSTIGTNTIKYSYTNPTDACMYTTVKNVIVNALPVVTISGLSAAYCQGNTGIPFTTNPAGGALSGTGINGTTFMPSALGQRIITYTYKDVNNCSNTATQSVTVNPLPAVSFTGLNMNYCKNSIPAALTGSPSGGIFGGTGINGNVFTPSTSGTNVITYTYKDVNNCSSSFVQNTIVSIPNTYIQFDGIDDFIKVPDKNVYNIGTSDFTLEATVIVSKAQSGTTFPIFSKYTNNTNGFSVYLTQNQLYMRLGGDIYSSNSFFDIRDNNPHVFTITRSGILVSFYMDHSYIGSMNKSSSPRVPVSINTTAEIYVGKDVILNGYLKGYVSDVRFWSTVNLWSASIGELSPGLIGYWPMTDCDGQYVTDYSSSVNNGILGATAATETTDPIRSTNPFVFNPDLTTNAIAFDGYINNSKHIEIPNHPTYNSFRSRTDFTIEVKMQSTGTFSSNYPTILSRRTTATGGFVFGIHNGKLFLNIGGVMHYDNSNTYNLLNKGVTTCYNLACTRSVYTYTFYVNGIATSSFTDNTDIGSSHSIWLGNDNISNNILSCKIDELRIWNIAKTASQMNADINAVLLETTPNLIGYYTFQENNNAQWIIDRSSTNNPGFLGSNANDIDADDPIRINLACYSNSRTAGTNDAPVSLEGTVDVIEKVILYPNPSENMLTLKILNGEGVVTIHVIDAEGRLIYVKENHSAKEELLFGDEFPQGIYLIQFINKTALNPVKFIKIK